jgi:flavin reductase (DIM6/NTAB) family NADH-FMN oxidoreductase RutF
MTELTADDEANRGLRRAFGAFATGVAVVAVRRADGAMGGLTVNSFGSVSLVPPLVLWSLDEACARYAAFAEADLWGVTVLGADEADLAIRFTRADNGAIAPEEAAFLAGAPVLKAGVAHFACRSFDRRRAGDHLMLIGEVLEFRAAPGAALTFYRGRYGAAPDPWDE